MIGLGYPRPSLQACQPSPRAGRPERLVNPFMPMKNLHICTGGYKWVKREGCESQSLHNLKRKGCKINTALEGRYGSDKELPRKL